MLPVVHPPLVHFPIAFYLLGVLFVLLYLLRRRPELERFSYWSFGLAWLGTIVAGLSGLVDQSALALDDPRRAVVNQHITAAVALLVVNGLVVYMRFRWPNALTIHRWPYLALIALGAALVIATSFIGGRLVFELGVGVSPAAP